MSALNSPIVITGMHRSGTTLVTELLREHGVFTGTNLDPNQEDFFFLKRNEWLMRRAGGAWHTPSNTLKLLADPDLFAAASKRFARDVQSMGFARFMGIGSYLRTLGRGGPRAPWGWKDPRMVFTLPLWQAAFPNARLLYVYRNGVDVAASLRARDRQRLASKQSLDSQLHCPGLIERLRNACQQIEFHPHYLYPAREFTLQSGFDLWEEYVAQGERLFADYPGPKLGLRFEDLTTNSEPALLQLASFAGLSDPGSFVASWKAKMRPDRVHAFLEDSELRDFYASVRHSHWMHELDYSDLL